MRRLLVILLALLALGAAASAAVAWALTHRLRAPYDESPALFGVRAEPLRLTTADGLGLGAWLTAGEPGRPCVVFLHGNGGSRSQMRARFERLSGAGYCVLAITMRAHGDSDGDVNDIGLSARADVVAAVAHLERAQPGRAVFVVGHSLGAAAAIFAARDLGTRVAGYQLEQPYRDLESATRNRLRMYLPAALEDPGYAVLALWAGLFLDAPIAAISPAARAADIPSAVPVVVMTGSDDRHATLDDVRAVFAPVAEHGRLVVFPGATHVDLAEYDPRLYLETLAGLTTSTASGTSMTR